jgi:hypothetical protein
MEYQTNDDPGHARIGALEALRDAAHEIDIDGDYRTISAGFDTEDYEQIIALAWRHQFNDDRSQFKREIRGLQEHVAERIIGTLERSE